MTYQRWALALFCVSSVLGSGGFAAAAQHDVNATHDGHDADVGDGVCEDAAGFCTLRAAVEQANATPGVDGIYIPQDAAPYELTIVNDRLEPQQLTVYDYVTIQGDGQELSVISGKGETPVLGIHGIETLVLDTVTSRIRSLGWNGGGGAPPGIWATIPAPNPLRLITVAPNSFGRDVFVTTLNDGVLRFDAETGAFVGTIIPANVGGTTIAADDMVFGPSGTGVHNHIFVSNLLPGGGVYHFDESGTFIDVWDTGGSQAGAMQWIDGASPELVVAFPGADVLASFDQFGNRLSNYAASPMTPRDLLLTDDYLYVAGEDSDAVWRVERASRFLELFIPPGEGGLDEPQDIGFSPSGELLVNSHGTDELLRYDGRTGTFNGVFASGSDPTMDDVASFAFRVDAGPGPSVTMFGLTIADGGRISGADSCFTVGTSTAAIVSDVTVRDCYSSQFGGGVQNRGYLSLDRVEISNNRLPVGAAGGQTSNGGGICNLGQLFISNSLISDNFATRGGAITAYTGATRTDVVNTTISGNYSGANGAVRVISGTLSLVHSTVTNNETPKYPPNDGANIDEAYAAGVFIEQGATMYIANSVVAGNISRAPSTEPNKAPDCFSVSSDGSTVPGNVVSLTDNVIGVVNGRCGVVDEGGLFPSDLLFGDDTNPFDPMLDVLADNGGPSWTHLPLPGSPLIDGDLTDHGLTLYNCKYNDQRLQPRPLDGDGSGSARCDVGAVEVREATALDNDADGIDNSIDAEPFQYSFYFSDEAASGNSSGQIVSLGEQLVSIEDAADPSEGITVSTAAIGGAEPVVLSLCEDGVTVTLAAGETETFTCVTADAGPDQTVECEDQDGADITLSGTGTTLSGAEPSFEWSVPGVVLDDETLPSTIGTFPIGTTPALLSVTNGNEYAVDEVSIEVVDTTPPTLTVPADVVVGNCFNVQIGQATATDACDDEVTIDNDAPTNFTAGTWSVTWTATDAAGNQTQATQKVVVGLGESVACCPANSNVILGTWGNDVLSGTAGADCILGFGASDVIDGMGGNDVISGGEGEDMLIGGSGNDVLEGNNGQDVLEGESGEDALFGGGGDDELYAGVGADVLVGGQGQDYLDGNSGDDALYGNDGVDTLVGGDGNDFLDGGLLHDQCFDDPATSVFLHCENQASAPTCNEASFEAETMYHSTGGSVQDGWNIWSNGYISSWHDFSSGSSQITVTARGEVAQGVWPHMVVTVGGVAVGDVYVSSSSWQPYDFQFTTGGGSQEIRVIFDNDHYSPPQDRNLLVDDVVVDCEP